MENNEPIESPEVTEQSQSQETAAETPVETPVEAKPTPVLKRKYKLKVDGKEEEIEADDAELTTYLQKGIAAQKRFDEAAKARKEAEAKLAKLKDNPWDVIKELGLDPMEAASKFVIEQYELQQMTPEQRKLRELEIQNKQLMELKQRFETETKNKELQAKQDLLTKRYTKELEESLSGQSFPATPAIVNLITQRFNEKLSQLSSEEEQDALSVKDIIPEVVQFYRNELRQGLQFYAKDGKGLRELLGDELLTQLRKVDVAELKTQAKATAPATTQKEPSKPRNFSSWEEFKAYYGVKS